ncbi:MAG: tetratricopeptide repeat protein [Sphingomonas sp.]
MRISSLAAAAALVFACASSALHGQRADNQIDPRSIALLASARAAQAAGNYTVAAETLETALAVDPRNRGALVALGQVALARGFSGQSIRYYREALLLEPNDLAALKGQGEALVAKGALERARQNLAKIRKLCVKSCEEGSALAAVIAKGPPVVASVAPGASKGSGAKE